MFPPVTPVLAYRCYVLIRILKNNLPPLDDAPPPSPPESPAHSGSSSPQSAVLLGNKEDRGPEATRAQLVRDTLYPNLQDHPAATEYPNLLVFTKRLSWLDHQESEASTDLSQVISTSHSNDSQGQHDRCSSLSFDPSR